MHELAISTFSGGDAPAALESPINLWARSTLAPTIVCIRTLAQIIDDRNKIIITDDCDEPEAVAGNQ